MTTKEARERLKNLYGRQGRYYDAMTDQFDEQITDIIVKATARVTTGLERLSLDGSGHVTRTTKNVARLARIDWDFEQAMKKLGYPEAVRSFVKSFPGQLPMLEEELRIMAAAMKKRPIDVTRGLVAEDTRNELAGVQTVTVDQLESAVVRAADRAKDRVMLSIGGLDRAKTAELLAEQFMRTRGEARTLAATSQAMFHRTAQSRALAAAGIDAARFVYDGPDDKLTRPFCRVLKRLMRDKHVTWSRAEIDRMDNGQLPDVFTSGGGYNCRHQWRIALPDEVAADKGAPPPPEDKPVKPQPAPQPQQQALSPGDQVRAKWKQVAQSFEAQRDALYDQDLALGSRQGELIGQYPVMKDRPREVVAEIERLRRQRTEIMRKQTELFQQQAQARREAVYAERPLKVEYTRLSGDHDGPLYNWLEHEHTQLDAKVHEFAKIVGDQVRIDTDKKHLAKPMFRKDTVRANYKPGKGMITVSMTDGPEVVVHELGHWLEDVASDVHKRTVEFLERRAGKDTPVHMSEAPGGHNAFDPWEFTQPDAFKGPNGKPDPYVGKLYLDGGIPSAISSDRELSRKFWKSRLEQGTRRYATEVVSMGLQWLYQDPVGFAEKDPEYFDFMMSLIRR